jgi:hypothetical protein
VIRPLSRTGKSLYPLLSTKESYLEPLYSSDVEGQSPTDEFPEASCENVGEEVFSKRATFEVVQYDELPGQEIPMFKNQPLRRTGKYLILIYLEERS